MLCETIPPHYPFPEESLPLPTLSPHATRRILPIYHRTCDIRAKSGMWHMGGRLMSVRVSENQNETSEKKRRPV